MSSSGDIPIEIIAGFLVLMLGIVSFSIQMAIKRSKKQNSPAQDQVQREKATDTQREKNALAEAMRRKSGLTNYDNRLVPTRRKSSKLEHAPSVKLLTATVIVFTTSLTLTGCFGTPPTVGSLAIDRAADVAQDLLAAPDDAQIATYKRELITNYQAIGMTVTENTISAAEWTTIIAAALKTCRELASGVSETDMMAKMIDDLEQQQPNADPALFSLVAGSSLTAIKAPGSLCP